MDLGILVLRIGGPRLLDTFNHLNYLPSSSLIYKAVKNKIHLEVDITAPLKDTIQKNIIQFYKDCSGFFTIKMDEIALVIFMFLLIVLLFCGLSILLIKVEKIRYHKQNNSLVGSCVNHKLDEFNYQFNNWTDLDHLHDSLLNNETHLANEALVITLSSIASSDNYPRPVVISPICSHSNDELVSEAIKLIIESFHSLNPGSSIVNVATDGDASRRKTLNKLRSPQTKFSVLKRLQLFDQNLLLGKKIF